MARLTRLLFATCAALSVTIATAHADPAPAQAPAGKKLVVLGDSFSANNWDPFTENVHCVRKDTSWPTQLTTLMKANNDVVDVSCSGASIDTGPGFTLALETRDADRAGGFGPATELVALQFGANDSWGEHPSTLWNALTDCVLDLIRGCDIEAAEQGRIPDFRGVTGERYAERMRNALTYIRFYAPNARVVIVGYPEVMEPGATKLCLNVFGPSPIVQPRAQALQAYLNSVDTAQREAAKLLGVEFFDARAATRGHGLCSAEPWINGIIDPRADAIGLPFHPSARGDAAVAQAIFDSRR
ncbi:SGNH/GDSL hydrolase family protein [Nocardia camponoti]|uniref:SGNH hydrolase-type esterase domain-containing protein n=1 Tax=Nocardia camponoti TaxID=1616106 RepID=A0A917QLW5_9NOCA|nr:SGNH/GDSL hydrolase family protein [Nocardia camponoti]GGK57701.1 hypothetical protein GCM10011591_32340 [Nocardia camponoti]